MTRAADYLEKVADGRVERGPLLDITGCAAQRLISCHSEVLVICLAQSFCAQGRLLRRARPWGVALLLLQLGLLPSTLMQQSLRGIRVS